MFFPPAYCFRKMPDAETLPKDHLGREIALFLFQFPETLSEFANLDVKSLSRQEKEEVFVRMKTLLGIKPLKTRHLGYCGD